MNYIELQNKMVKDYRIKLDPHSSCWSRTHVHIKQRRICKWKQASSIRSTFTLLHEIGHCETKKSWMRRCESEFYATQWALDRCKELKLNVPDYIIEDYQDYVFRELDRGLRRGGANYPTREEMTLVKG